MTNNNNNLTETQLLPAGLEFNSTKSAYGHKGIHLVEILDRPTVLLVDTHVLYLRGVKEILEESADFEFVGVALSANEAILRAEQTLPDVILCSVNLPGMSGYEVCRTIRHRLPQTSVILLSESEDDEQLFLALRAGAAAYSDKNMSSARLLEIVNLVVGGNYLINEQVILKPLVAKQVLQQFNELTITEVNAAASVFAPLTNREITILNSIARGNSNKEIGLELVISDQTVKNHITNILRKLNANDRTHAVITGLRNGWINIPEINIPGINLPLY